MRALATAAIGTRAGYSRGIVNHQFGSRDEFMVRLAEMVQGRFVPDDRTRGLDRVLAVVDAYLGTLRSDPRQVRVFLRLWAAAVGNEEPSLRDAFVRRDAVFRELFEDALARGRRTARSPLMSTRPRRRLRLSGSCAASRCRVRSIRSSRRARASERQRPDSSLSGCAGRGRREPDTRARASRVRRAQRRRARRPCTGPSRRRARRSRAAGKATHGRMDRRSGSRPGEFDPATRLCPGKGLLVIGIGGRACASMTARSCAASPSD